MNHSTNIKGLQGRFEFLNLVSGLCASFLIFCQQQGQHNHCLKYAGRGIGFINFRCLFVVILALLFFPKILRSQVDLLAWITGTVTGQAAPDTLAFGVHTNATFCIDTLPGEEENWDASSVPSGVYFYRLQAGNFSDIKKMLLVR